MALETEERYLEWLEREEEVVGLLGTVGATTDIELARQLLREELGYGPTDAQLNAFMGAGTIKYERFPEAGIHFERVEQAWGYQTVYRDIESGKFVSRSYVLQALERLGL